jgi:hypothetical protein
MLQGPLENSPVTRIKGLKGLGHQMDWVIVDMYGVRHGSVTTPKVTYRSKDEITNEMSR